MMSLEEMSIISIEEYYISATTSMNTIYLLLLEILRYRRSSGNLTIKAGKANS